MHTTTAHLFMVRPASFGFNPETATNNAFQTAAEASETEAIARQAKAEFDDFVKKLRAAGVQVTVYNDAPKPVKPDAVFPNNWISFHEDGTVVTYPMFSPLRRLERRSEVIKLLRRNYTVGTQLRLEDAENKGTFLEGTGSLVLDRPNKIAYACRSIRTDDELFKIWATQLGYTPIIFDANDQKGDPIYHTNVMMAMGSDYAVVCLASVPEGAEKEAFKDTLTASGKTIIDITLAQMNAYAGNMLEVKSAETGDAILVMSSQAYNSLSKTQIKELSNRATLLHSSLETIEKYGGGSARCMMAEVFLPVKLD